ncbi:MAG: macro domain-containing protein [Vulcanimicrobiota bacterium]
MGAELVERIRSVVRNPSTGWVLFEHGTVVFVPAAEGELAEQASALLSEHGPVHAGSPAGDFGVSGFDWGWAVSAHHPDLMTFLLRADLPADSPDVQVGLVGRQRRDQDAAGLQVVHVEPPRPGLGPSHPEQFESLEAACLAVLDQPGPEVFARLWEAVDKTVSAPLLAVLAALDPKLVEQAKRRILLNSGPGQLSLALLEVLWHSDERAWVSSHADFSQVCEWEWLDGGRHSRCRVVEDWVVVAARFPHQARAPIDPEGPDLVAGLWPESLPLPGPEMAQRELFVDGSPTSYTDWLLSGEDSFTLETDDLGVMVYRRREMPVRLFNPFGRLYREMCWRDPRALCESSRSGLEVRVAGGIYGLTRTRLERVGAPLVATGIDHNGRMKGAAAAAIQKAAGPHIEAAAQQALAATDRSLGTVVVTDSFDLRAEGIAAVAHVVSTPKHTPESPGWLQRAIPALLTAAVEGGWRFVAVVALGTSGGISFQDCARLTIDSCERWFAQDPNSRAMMITFSVPDGRAYEAFSKEMRQRMLKFRET